MLRGIGGGIVGDRYLRGTQRGEEKLQARPFEFCQGSDITHTCTIGRALNDEILVTVQ